MGRVELPEEGEGGKAVASSGMGRSGDPTTVGEEEEGGGAERWRRSWVTVMGRLQETRRVGRMIGILTMAMRVLQE
jgi:hypothetical protein